MNSATATLRTALVAAAIILGCEAAAQTEPGAAPRDPAPLLRLGDLYYDGEVVDGDLARAFDYYAQAAAAGSQTGKLRMGEMLARGEGTARDVERGRALVQELADSGHLGALVALGDLHARGDGGPMNPSVALRSYEKATTLGNTDAMIRLGDILLYGRFAAPNPRKALDYYRRAAAGGNPYGLYGVGKIYVERMVRRAGTPAEGIALLRQADRAGVTGAIAAISDGYFRAEYSRRGVKQALATLTDAARAGNLHAARELVAVYRDGKRDGRVTLVPPNRKLARSHFAAIRSRLAPGLRLYDEYLLESAVASRGGYGSLYGRLRTMPIGHRSSLVREMLTVNPNFYAYIAQVKLRELGFFRGQPTGRMNAGTVRALRRYCGLTGTIHFCRNGPMTGQTAELLSYAF